MVMGCAVETGTETESNSTSESAINPACDMVRCAYPLCNQGQHAAFQGSCCAVCVGASPDCAAVQCAAPKCLGGEILVTPPGQCCPRCHKAPPVATCDTTMDCPVYDCASCPCPTSECVNRKCQTSTPDSSTCAPVPN
jgi:hypothetical protein